MALLVQTCSKRFVPNLPAIMKAGFLLSKTIVQRPATMSSKTMPANEVRNLGHYHSAMPIGAIPMSDCKRLVLIALTQEELEDKAARKRSHSGKKSNVEKQERESNLILVNVH